VAWVMGGRYFIRCEKVKDTVTGKTKKGVLEAMTVRPSPRVAACHLMMRDCLFRAPSRG
jgi:hypothetical protein